MKLTDRIKSRISLALAAVILVLGASRATAKEAAILSPPQEAVTEVEKKPIPERWRKLRLVDTFTGHKTAVFSLLFVSIPQGEFLVSGGGFNDSQLVVWRLNLNQKPRRVERFRAQRTAITTLAASPDGKNLLSAGDDSVINILDVTAGKTLGQFIAHLSNVLDIAITPDSRILVSGGLDGIKVWELTSRRPLFQLTGFGSPSYKLAIHRNGYLLASGNKEGRVQFWDLRTAKIISAFSPHQEQISGLIFTPDGRRLITASRDRTVNVWDLATGELLQTLQGHTQEIRAIALNPDGQTLASVGKDGLRLWNIKTGKLLIVMNPYQDWVESVAFSPDGRFMATGSFNSSIKLWEAPPLLGKSSESSESTESSL